MPMEYVNRLISNVETKTGYPVTVINDDTLQTNSAMKVASKELSHHIIMLNPKYERGADYLIAVQCLMLPMKSGFDINSSEQKYTLKSLPGKFSGLHLVSYMYVGFKKVAPDADAGIDLSKEYESALKLFKSENN